MFSDCSSVLEKGSPAMSREEIEECFSESEEGGESKRRNSEMQSRELAVMPLYRRDSSNRDDTLERCVSSFLQPALPIWFELRERTFRRHPLMRISASSISASVRLLLNPPKQHSLSIIQIQILDGTNSDSTHNPTKGKACQVIVPNPHSHMKVTTINSVYEWLNSFQAVPWSSSILQNRTNLASYKQSIRHYSSSLHSLHMYFP